MRQHLDGFETCRQLKQFLPNTPIIFMTGLSDVEDIVRGFEAGGIDYVTKPISPDEVIARIKTHIQTAKLALSAQDALDHAGNMVFCVNQQGRLSRATPRVHQIIENLADGDASPWATLAPLIESWLAQDSPQELALSCFAQTINVAYQRQQGDKHLLQIIQAKTAKKPSHLQQQLPITKRESEVLYWVSYGKTSWEIAKFLNMSPRTVNKHLEQIFKKLGVDNRTSAAAISLRILGL